MKTTILTCTPDSTSELFKKHKNALKKYTKEYEHIIIDNNYDENFNHAKEINRIFQISKSDYIVLLDDDTIVTKNWLTALIEAQKSTNAAVVGGIHYNSNKKINHAGAYMTYDGVPGHYLNKIKGIVKFSFLCSAVLLIDYKACIENGIYFDENYNKYYQDADFCFHCWDKGRIVVLTPLCEVFHLVNEYRKINPIKAQQSILDRKYFMSKWSFNNKLLQLTEKINTKLYFGGIESLKSINELNKEYNYASVYNSEVLFKKILMKYKFLEHTTHGRLIYGSTFFKLGMIEFNNKIYKRALMFFNKTLEYINNHNKALFLKKKIYKILLKK